MKRSKLSRAFTMVEILAVIAVMSVLVALTIPNGIFARTAAEEAVAKSVGASFELAMSTYLTKSGAAAQQNWEQAWEADQGPHNLFLTLQSSGAFPSSTSWSSVSNSLAGYTMILPKKLTGKVTVIRSTDSAVVYP